MIEQNQKKLIKWLSGVVIAAAVLSVLIFTGVLNPAKIKKLFMIEPDSHLMTNRNAYDIALLEAQKWQPDAKLAFMDSGSISERGRSNTWKAIFISSKVKAKGFSIEIEDYKIILLAEIIYNGVGADFPTNIISSEDAIKMVRATKGYEDAEIYGAEVIYMGNLWYWGVKTSKGVVSVKGK
ncbi:MAG: hypothetical protein AAB366_01660 [Patescibacteria group bacterium]